MRATRAAAGRGGRAGGPSVGGLRPQPCGGGSPRRSDAARGPPKREMPRLGSGEREGASGRKERDLQVREILLAFLPSTF